MKRVESLLREEISTMILLNVIKDPRVSTFLSVTEVKVSKDTNYAKVYVSSFQKDTKLESAVDALNHAAGFIQNKLGEKLSLRNTPHLSFIADHSIKQGIEMTHKIEEL
jgi:ribosome-binding factor A